MSSRLHLRKRNKLFYYFIYFAILTNVVFGQSFTLVNFLGDFDNASSFSQYSSGFYVTDKGNNTVVKIDTSGNIEKIIGGYGWDESSFDNPTDVFAAPLKVFVSDKDNNRVQVFDRFLNYLFSIKSSDTFYPSNCAVSAQGDIFILDADNVSILKYDMSGHFIDNIGQISSGDFTLQNPKAIAVSDENNLYVADNNRLLIFDLFGSGKSIIKLKFNPENLSVNNGMITLTTPKKVYLLNLQKTKIRKFDLSKQLENRNIIDAEFSFNKLFVLTENQILVFNIPE